METILLTLRKSRLIFLKTVLLLIISTGLNAQLINGVLPSDPNNESLLGHKYRGIRTNGNSGGQEVFIGATSLSVPHNRAVNNLNYGPVIVFSISYNPVNDEFINVTSVGINTKTVKSSISTTLVDAGKIHTLYDLNYFQIEAKNQINGSGITITNLSLNGNAIPGIYSNNVPGSVFWHNYAANMSNGFTLTGLLQLNGTFGNAQDQNYVEFTFGYSRIFASLPLSWDNISATRNNSSVNINWSTMQELNTERFEVQRSSDNRSFATVSSLPARGNSNGLQHYHVTDPSPYNGINYYRVKEIDRNGLASYSSTVMLNMKNNKHQVITVNQTDLQIQFSSTDKRTIQLINMNGVMLKNEKVADAVYKSSLATLPKGIYLLRIVEEDGTLFTQKIIL